MNWNCDDGHGNNIAQGLTRERACKIAQEHADKTGLACLVYKDRPGGEVDRWVVPAYCRMDKDGRVVRFGADAAAEKKTAPSRERFVRGDAQ